jgi:hypothetical protein
MRSGIGFIAAYGLPGREFGEFEPVLLNVGDEFDAFVELDRFDQVIVRAEPVTCLDVFIAVGGGEDNNRDVAKSLSGFYLGEDFEAAFAWQVEVEEDEVRPRGAAGAGVFAALEEEVEGFFAIAGDGDAITAAAAAERFDGDLDVGGVVFDQ